MLAEIWKITFVRTSGTGAILPLPFSSVGFSAETELVVAHDKRGRLPNPKLSSLKINVLLSSPQILGSNVDSTRHFSAESSVLPSFYVDDEPAQE